ncbi:MAG: hypothetical protein J3K34DRAFT_52759 [Monoraphidium minutum]|nr:MAG: hypothetical protein J3K34DRAFT_52759 [Monoraphidium minutum]
MVQGGRWGPWPRGTRLSCDIVLLHICNHCGAGAAPQGLTALVPAAPRPARSAAGGGGGDALHPIRQHTRRYKSRCEFCLHCHRPLPHVVIPVILSTSSLSKRRAPAAVGTRLRALIASAARLAAHLRRRARIEAFSLKIPPDQGAHCAWHGPAQCASLGGRACAALPTTPPLPRSQGPPSWVARACFGAPLWQGARAQPMNCLARLDL